MIEEYFKSLLQQIDAFPYTESQSLGIEQRSEAVGYLRGDVFFTDGSRLHMRELVNLSKGGRLKYIYHYQRADGSLVFRYDSAPHFPDLPNAPHHKHMGNENSVVSSSSPELASILQEIESLLQVDYRPSEKEMDKLDDPQ